MLITSAIHSAMWELEKRQPSITAKIDRTLTHTQAEHSDVVSNNSKRFEENFTEAAQASRHKQTAAAQSCTSLTIATAVSEQRYHTPHHPVTIRCETGDRAKFTSEGHFILFVKLGWTQGMHDQLTRTYGQPLSLGRFDFRFDLCVSDIMTFESKPSD